MRKRLLFLAVLLAAGFGCQPTPVETATSASPIQTNQLAPSTDTAARGGNVMGGGH